MLRSRSTVLAFAGVVLFGGLNAVGVKLAGAELEPFWSAALRLIIASAVLFAVVVVRRATLPRGRALLGSMLYGVLGFGAFFGFIYWGLVRAPAGLTMVILALVPLMTLLLAAAHGLERLRPASLAGVLIAVAGIGFIASQRPAGQSAELLGVGAVAIAAAALAESNILVKLLPRPRPLVNNAIGMAVGAAILLPTSLLAGEPWLVPQQVQTVGAVAYLALGGSVGLFMLYLIVIERWSASATSYALLLMPLVAAIAAAVVLGEPITPAFVVGSAVVLVGIYVGAFGPTLRRPLPGLFHRPVPAAARAAADGPPTLVSPNCP